MNKEVAHLFWHGEISKLEKICIQSFAKMGFDTKIWSYTGIEIDGAESCDARLVLPEENLSLYKQQHFSDTNGSKQFYCSMAAFSDAFRWNVVNKFGGWWFDADCFCLKPAEEFTKLREGKQIVACLQDHECPSINSGAFYADYNTSLLLVERLNNLCKQYNYNFNEWGVIGPLLISNVIQDNNLLEHVVSIENFYSIESNQFNYFIDPNLKETAKSYITNSYVSHIWHSKLGLHNIDKNNPPNESLLKEFYDGSFINDQSENSNRILKYKNSLNRYINVSKIYKKILGRSGDVTGIGHYVRTGMSMNELEQIFLNSDEYKTKTINKNKIILYKQPKTFVIALKDNDISLSQLHDCLNSAKDYNWDIEVFWGTNGKTLSLDSWKHLGVKPLLHKGSMNKPGTWGCFFSHFALWNKCIELNEPIVVLEHDAIIKCKWVPIEVSNALVKLHEDYSFKRDSNGFLDPAGFMDADSGQGSVSTHAYCITPEQANKLICFAKTVGGYATDRMIGNKVLPIIHIGDPTIVARQNTYSTTENL